MLFILSLYEDGYILNRSNREESTKEEDTTKEKVEEVINEKKEEKDHSFSIRFIISHYTSIFKKDGLKGVLKEGGWKVLFYFFMFYLIRDTILYIIIPYLIIKGIIVE